MEALNALVALMVLSPFAGAWFAVLRNRMRE